jgi:hypothetical protein
VSAYKQFGKSSCTCNGNGGELCFEGNTEQGNKNNDYNEKGGSVK